MAHQVSPLLRSKLENVFNTAIKNCTNLEVLSSGWESIIYSFKITFEDNNENELVLRAFQGDNTDDKATNEYKVLQFLRKQDLSVPKVYILDISKKNFPNNFIIMDRIRGKNVGDILAKSIHNRTVFLDIFEKLISLQKKIHEIPLELLIESGFESSYSGKQSFVDYFISLYSTILKNAHTTIFDEYIKWLQKNKELGNNTILGLSHLDFHPWNALMTEQNEIYVIDWPSARIIDIRFDIAWSLLMLYHKEITPYLNKIQAIYEKKYFKEQLTNLNYFLCLAGLRRLVDAYLMLAGSSNDLGVNPEASEQVKKLDFHYRTIIAKIETITQLNFKMIKEKILV